MRPPDKTPTIDRALATTVKESKAPAISRAAAVLRLLGKSDVPLGLQSIAREAWTGAQHMPVCPAGIGG